MEFFDVFVRCPDGKLRWIECVEGLAIAQQDAIRFSERFSGESLIYSERDGLIVKRIDRASTTVGPPSSRTQGIGGSSWRHKTSQ
jgi:hypothetical protein